MVRSTRFKDDIEFLQVQLGERTHVQYLFITIDISTRATVNMCIFAGYVMGIGIARGCFIDPEGNMSHV
jgi:hypothetical protein